MTIEQRIKLLVQLGEELQQTTERNTAALQLAHKNNYWFRMEDLKTSVAAIADQYLQADKLEAWLESYSQPLLATSAPKTIGLIMAGNLPLVGFHDFLCVFISGHIAQIKLSEKDKYLFQWVYMILKDLNPSVEKYIKIVSVLKDFDAVIATGSNNSARYFEHYFGKYPHIIRKNRSSVAILTGAESPETITALGKDIFTYCGLGCRSVSKIFVPKNYDFTYLLDNLESYHDIILHTKYKNNYDYRRSIYLLNRVEHLASHHLMVLESKSVRSLISVLHYEYYENEDDLANLLIEQNTDIQCVVADDKKNTNYVPFGKAQEPTLSDYADKVDTMNFLLSLKKTAFVD